MFWYLASPYSKYPLGITAAHYHVCQQAGLLIQAGVPVYSPIAHTHPIAQFSGIDPHDHDIWLPADKPIADAAGGLIVLKLEGWSRSFGIAEEIEWFASAGKPVVYMEPGEVPAELLQEGR
jgi:hypothetical protein